MRAQELRIGNLVECFGIREVIAIKKNKIKVQHESNKGHFIIEWVPIDSLSLKPIPLTEEWLLKFGFEYEDSKKELLSKHSVSFYIPYNQLRCYIIPRYL